MRIETEGCAYCKSRKEPTLPCSVVQVQQSLRKFPNNAHNTTVDLSQGCTKVAHLLETIHLMPPSSWSMIKHKYAQHQNPTAPSGKSLSYLGHSTFREVYVNSVIREKLVVSIPVSIYTIQKSGGHTTQQQHDFWHSLAMRKEPTRPLVLSQCTLNLPKNEQVKTTCSALRQHSIVPPSGYPRLTVQCGTRKSQTLFPNIVYGEASLEHGNQLPVVSPPASLGLIDHRSHHFYKFQVLDSANSLAH